MGTFFYAKFPAYLLKDLKAISKTYCGKIKSLVGFKTEYAKFFKEQDANYYQRIFDDKPLTHQDFIRFLKNKTDINAVLEIGCSTGIFPIKYSDLFKNTEYTGLDISQKCIDYCKSHSNFQFVCGDFLQTELNKKFDMVFSFDVIDHVYDIDLFLAKIIKSTKKYAYINSYRGYFPNLLKHRMNWKDSDGIFYNDLSVTQLKNTLTENGLKSDEFIVRSQSKDSENHLQTVIEICRKT